MKVLIIDDEAPARQRMRKLLGAELDIEIAGECENGNVALDAIVAHTPDLIFLDIQMPGRNGFDVLRDLSPDCRPLVVFVTAFDEHAVRAFEVHAVDYLLKPFRQERLHESLEHVRRILKDRQQESVTTKLEALLHAVPQNASAQYPQRLAVKDGIKISIVPVIDIVCCLASGNYVEICTRDGRRLLLRETMSHLESRLDPEKFFRANRSAILNLTHVLEIVTEGKGGHIVKMADGNKLPLTVSLKELQDRLVSPA
ncbi:MAG: LytTR family DNA-binding domain-containing protein [Chthoniobacterales bacterium]